VVISARDSDKAAAKIFHQKIRGQSEITREIPLEIRIRELGAGNNYNFQVWIEDTEGIENADDGREEKEAVKQLIIRKLS